ncbi:MAG: hypothetical protein UY21_C0001G0134 [Microgenomates group bacterium GW2011_GWA1_48_10]|nr:MAG: hypothetical protein UY21_C0001G0134 [Microgenomates group bacterium GW2011_GWA1_48_10]
MNEEINRRHDRFITGGSIVYLVGISALMLRHNIWFSPDQFFIFALVAAVIFGRGKKFISDWAPIILIFLSYEFFHGALPAILKFPVHSTDLIALEKFLFGSIPTVVLQQRFLSPGHFSIFDFLFSLTYMAFWIVPLIFLFWLWMRYHQVFKFIILAFFIGLYATFITMTFFPAMPPWMAAERGLIDPIQRVLYQTTAYLTVPGALPTLYQYFRGNEVAAMPSVHAEIPTLMFLAALLVKNKLLILLTLAYSLLTYVSIVYLGEHWAIDAIAGIFYAFGAFWGAKFVGEKLNLIHASAYRTTITSPRGVISTK